MTTLTDSPYELDYNDLVVVKVKAINANGDSSYSAVNTVGAYIETVPAKMTTPTKGSSTSYT